MADKLFRDYYNEKTEEVSLPVDGKLLVQTGTDEPDKIDVDLFATAAQGLKADGAIQKIGSQVVNAFLDIQNPLKANVYRFKIQNVLNANNVSSEFITGANSFLLATHTTGSLNFPEDQGQAAFFEGSSDGRDFAIWKNALVESDIRLGYKNGSNEWVWRKLPYTDEVATAAQGVLADNSVQLTGETIQTIEGEVSITDILSSQDIVASSSLGDIISLFQNRLGNSNMYGFGVAAEGLVYYKSAGNHEFYKNKNYDLNPNGVVKAGSFEANGNIKADAVINPLVTITTDKTLDEGDSRVIIDASLNTVTATLPLVSSTPIGKEYTVIGYDVTNVATLQTSGTDQIRLASSDTDTSRAFSLGEIAKLVNTGVYWQVTF